jgi:sugar lactone lactonase YvrE
MINYVRTTLAVTVTAAALLAGQTKTWSQGEYADFEKGVIKNLSLRSDGLLTLAPASRELFDSTSAYLWALAQDSKGILYAGGGANAKVFRIPPDGKGKVLAELDALQVQALAVDAKDRVYAATAPDGKVYRIAANGKPEVFYDPKAKYIWALAFDRSGDLLVATGDPGGVHRVTADGKGKVFFPCDETHIRSMALDAQGNLIVGTDPGGLVLRVTPAGESFVLYQMARKEVTAVAIAHDGTIYAAGVGNKSGGGGSSATALAPPPTVAPVTIGPPGSAAPGGAQRSPTPSAAVAGPPSGVSGGSEVYRIDPSGVPLKIWSNSQDVVYAIAFDASGRVLLGTGNKGSIYRIESPSLYTALLTAPATQVTAFLMGSGGRLYAAAGNVGKLYEIGPELEKEGTIESDTFDATIFSLWGRLSFEAKLNGGHVSLQTRSGNVDQPSKYWSPWSAAIAVPEGQRVVSPASRFVQWKATLMGDGAAGHSPELESVDLAYLPKNLQPSVEEIEMAPANYKFPAPSVPPSTTPASLSLPPLGRTSSPASPLFSLDSGSSTTSTPAMQYVKGQRGARWLAADPNGDSMVYSVEIRGAKETRWKPLKDKVMEKYFSFDTTAFPDGEYRLRITASDSPSNPPAEALSNSLVSDPFTIDNTPPRITGLTGAATGGKLRVRWRAADALNNVTKAEYSLDGGDWTLAAPVTKLSDSMELDYDLTLDAGPGEHTVAVRVQDDFDNQASEKVVVQ